MSEETSSRNQAGRAGVAATRKHKMVEVRRGTSRRSQHIGLADGDVQRKSLVGATGIEPVTSCVSSKRSTAELSAPLGQEWKIQPLHQFRNVAILPRFLYVVNVELSRIAPSDITARAIS